MPNLDYKEVINNDESLAAFLRAMSKYERYFCELMMAGVDFTLRLEVRGDKREILHCRVYNDGFDRPSSKNGIDRKNY